MKSAYDIIRNILLSEKSTLLNEQKQYAFKVCTCATKGEVAAAVEAIYGVKVKSVNLMNYKGKAKRAGRSPVPGHRSSWKKAIVSLAEGTITIE